MPGLQKAASDAAVEAQTRVQAAEEAAAVASDASKEAAEAAAARAKDEHDNLQRVLDAVNAQKADLEGKLAKAGGALNAAEELKEAKYVPKICTAFSGFPPTCTRDQEFCPKGYDCG